MQFEDVVINVTKVLGFVMIAVGIGMVFWSGFDVQTSELLLVVLGLLFSLGAFFLNDRGSPTETQLLEMRRKELDQIYLPAQYRMFDKKSLKFEALHRLTEQTEGIGDFSDSKGH